MPTVTLFFLMLCQIPTTQAPADVGPPAPASATPPAPDIRQLELKAKRVLQMVRQMRAPRAALLVEPEETSRASR